MKFHLTISTARKLTVYHSEIHRNSCEGGRYYLGCVRRVRDTIKALPVVGIPVVQTLRSTNNSWLTRVALASQQVSLIS